MKISKCKMFLTGIAAVLLAAAMLITAACSQTQEQPPVSATVTSITLSGQKTSFAYGEEFSVGDMVVSAHLNDGTQKMLGAGEYSVDSAKYNRMQPGNYEIGVTASGTSVKTTYTVTVQQRAILPEPTADNKIYVYDELDPSWSVRTINYELATGQDLDWEGRYTVGVYAPGDETNIQNVGMVAAYSQLHGQQLGLSTIGMFDFNGEVVVRVTADFMFEQVDIRPLSLGIEWERVQGMDNTIEFTLTRPCNISVEFDGNTCTNLMLFTGSIQSYSVESDVLIEELRGAVTDAENLIVVEPGTIDVNDIYARYSDDKHNVIVFGKGIYFLKEGSGIAGQGQFRIPSNSTVYIHGDAGIYGFLRVEDATNVSIVGRGYVSGQITGNTNILYVKNSKNVVVDGIVMYHSNNWTNVVTESQDVTYRNIRIAGQRRNNNDGFDICNSSDILVDNCWIRTIDDCITIKGRFGSEDTRMHIENIVVQNSTLWNYQGGNGIVVGSESCTDIYNNIIFRNIDIIHNTTQRAIAMEILDSAHVSNVVFDDIRMELDNDYSNSEYTYAYGSDYGNTSNLIALELITNENAFYGTDTEDGVISGVLFNNISYNGNPDRKIEFKGTSEDHQISNVRFRNFSYNGTLLNDFNASNYLTNGCAFYSDISFDSESDYIELDNAAFVVDDADISIKGSDYIAAEKQGVYGGGYTDCSVRLGDDVTATLNVEKDGYYMPAINFLVGESGGLFDIALDGEYVGTVNTYSETSEYMQYYLPMCFVGAGEHTLVFTARYTPGTFFEGWMLGLCLDYVSFVEMGSNYIEFEMLEGALRVADDYASGGYAADLTLNIGDSVTFTGTNTLARGAQLILTYLAGPDKGIYKFYFDGDLVSPDIDMYSPVGEYRTYAMGTVQLPAGQFTITVKCIGKNEASSGTAARLDCAKTLHLAVSKTYKGGYEGIYNNVTVSNGIGMQRGMFEPIRFSNITNGGTIAFSAAMSMPIDGIYDYRLYVDGFDPAAFKIDWRGQALDYSYQDGVISFRVSRALGDSGAFTFICNGNGTYSFDFLKAVIDPYEVDKSELRSLVALEDERDLSSAKPYLLENYSAALNVAKNVLFDRTSDVDMVQKAIEALHVAASRLDGGEAPYNEGLLTESEIKVFFDDAEVGDLAVLYLNSGSESVCYYAMVTGNGSALFKVDSKYIGTEVKLYCEIIGNPLAGAHIQQGDKIESALDFIFNDDYWMTEVEEGYRFDTLKGASSLVICFDSSTVREGEIVMVAFRNVLNEEIGKYFAFIGQDGVATISLADLPETENIYALVRVSINDDARVLSLYAEGVVLDSANGGQMIAGSETSGHITVSTALTADQNGAIHYQAQGGFKETQARIVFDQEFDSVTFDLSILAYCGSGGSDVVGIYNLNNTLQIGSMSVSTVSSALEGVSKAQTFTFSYDECGGGIILKIWIGCAGDWSQCKSDPPHGDELLTLGNIEFRGTVNGKLSDFRLLNGNSVEIPVGLVESYYFENLKDADSIIVEFDSASVQENNVATLSVYNNQGKKLQDIASTVNADGMAEFSTSEFQQLEKIYLVITCPENNEAEISAVFANISPSANVGNIIAEKETDSHITVTTSLEADENGAIHYPANGGRVETQVRISFDQPFESVTLDLTVLAFCGSGGNDAVYIYDLNNSQQIGSISVSTNYGATDSVTKTQTFTFTYDECGGGIILKIWIGCVGDWSQCKSDPPHDDELLTIGNVKFEGTNMTLEGVRTPLVIADSTAG